MARDWLGKPQIIEKLGLGLASGITGTIVLLSWLGVSPLVRLEGGSLDVRFKLRGERPAGQEVILVAIDEKSLQEVGQWPWSRDKQARLVTAIAVGTSLPHS